MSSQLLSLDVIFEEVAGNFSKTLSKNIKITRIEPETVKQWNTGWRPINRRKKPDGGWDWAQLRKEYYFKKYPYVPRRKIDIVIWEGEIPQLCGLVLGGVAKDTSFLTIDYVEGAPDLEGAPAHPLKGHILDMVFTIVKSYAMILNINELRLNDPVDGLIHLYESEYGFKTKHDGKKTYCFQRLNDEHANLK